MTHKQLDALFTLKVSEYICEGFLLHVPSLRSLEGNMGKIVLVKDDTYIHISIERDYNVIYKTNTVSIIVRFAENLKLSSADILWPYKMKEIKRYTFYYFSRELFSEASWFFENIEDLQQAEEKRRNRSLSVWIRRDYKKIPVKSMESPVMRHVRSLKGSKRAKPEDVTIHCPSDFGKPVAKRYHVCYQDKCLYIL